ncbi:MAG: hypothetical protein KY445_09865, partial [Armatimonadetes bacterium]|nr:hypothetical protein [Armatimonadota bacterium]
MQFLSRGLFTIALLGGLAFGSYAFGRYVLSSHLFGPKGAGLKQNIQNSDDVPAPLPKVSIAPAKPETAPSKSNARVDVEILPADPEDDRALPPISSLERDRSAAPRRPPTPPSDPSPRVSAPAASSSDDSPTITRRESVSDEASSSDENRPRRRKRRRRVTEDSERSEPRVERRRRTRRADSSPTSTRETTS